jgi:hypothetical protein
MSDKRLLSAWGDVIEDGAFSEAACVCWVRNLAPEDALRRLGAQSPFSRRTLGEVDGAVNQLYSDISARRSMAEPVGAIADRIGSDWILIVEPNGWAATTSADLAKLSDGTEAVSIFWNVNVLTVIAVARGEPVAVVHEVIEFVCGDDDEPRRSLAGVEGTKPDVVEALVRRRIL